MAVALAASPARWARPVAVGLTLTLLGLAVYEAACFLRGNPSLLATDITGGYLPGAQRWLDTGTPYTPEQLAGPWTLGVHTFIHPPAALPLFAAFLVLPLPLWWAIPLGITAYALWRLQPAPWAWPVMAACLLWPRSVGALLAGNSDLWAMAAVAAGTVWGWPIVLLAVKPTFAPLALVAVNRRSAWIAGVLMLGAMALTLPLWLDWWRVTQGAGLQWWYSLLNVPLVLLPAVAWAARAPSPSS